MAERAEKDIRGYGNEYDKRLSIRVAQKHIDRVDAMADAAGKPRPEFVRDIIDKMWKRFESSRE